MREATLPWLPQRSSAFGLGWLVLRVKRQLSVVKVWSVKKFVKIEKVTVKIWKTP